jgi:hypothetical protein
MSKEMKAFLNELADLCNKYEAQISYTIDDDGLHVGIGGEEVCIGFPSSPNPGNDIREYIF